MSHKEFAARHPHPPQPYRVTTDDINRQKQSVTDRHKEETKETETYIEWMFHHVKEKMKKRITLENKTDPGKEVHEESSETLRYTLLLVDFHVLAIKLNWNYSLLLGRAFMATVGAVSNMQTNRLCLTLIDPNVYYDPVKVVKTHMPYMEIGDDLGLIAVFTPILK
ncbi:hypothetical protein F2Q68_00039437 [Brassica cretica]|uniref:Uncharacterized protein n=1 Tax=Brassica cretica TaxID=69181 RepID=A0A8S9MHM9_BRACR|nr:hypothetical protein F2Q68_00039437 [Brassica cretica]